VGVTAHALMEEKPHGLDGFSKCVTQLEERRWRGKRKLKIGSWMHRIQEAKKSNANHRFPGSRKVTHNAVLSAKKEGARKAFGLKEKKHPGGFGQE